MDHVNSGSLAISASTSCLVIGALDVSSQFYYAKGKLLGFLLDAMIRDATDGASSLDDVMQRLFRERYQAERGFTTDDVLDFVDDYVDANEVREFYDGYVDGRDPLPYAEVLAKIGLAYRVEVTTPPFLGIGSDVGPSGEIVIVDITPGSAAEAAGIQVGDVLLAIGEVQVVPDADWSAAFRERYAGAEGAPLPILVRRDGAEVTLQGTVRTREPSAADFSWIEAASPSSFLVACATVGRASRGSAGSDRLHV